MLVPQKSREAFLIAGETREGSVRAQQSVIGINLSDGIGKQELQKFSAPAAAVANDSGMCSTDDIFYGFDIKQHLIDMSVTVCSLKAQTTACIGLRVYINEEGLFLGGGKAGGKVYRGCRFAYATFLIRNGDYSTVHASRCP